MLILIGLFSLRIWQTTGCQQFSHFRFDPLSVKISVESQVGLDNTERFISRFFHNKITTGVFEISKSYTLNFDTRFLIEVLGPLGLVLVLLAIYHIFKVKNSLGFIHFSFVLLIPITKILPINSALSYYIFAVNLYGFSLWGLDGNILKKQTLLLVIILIPITLWYFAFSWQMPTICHEIAFN